jgi:hypothetical protein
VLFPSNGHTLVLRDNTIFDQVPEVVVSYQDDKIISINEVQHTRRSVLENLVIIPCMYTIVVEFIEILGVSKKNGTQSAKEKTVFLCVTFISDVLLFLESSF